MKQTGARFLAKRKRDTQNKPVVCTQHYKSDEPWVRVSDTCIKRVRCLKRKAE